MQFHQNCCNRLARCSVREPILQRPKCKRRYIYIKKTRSKYKIKIKEKKKEERDKRIKKNRRKSVNGFQRDALITYDGSKGDLVNSELFIKPVCIKLILLFSFNLLSFYLFFLFLCLFLFILFFFFFLLISFYSYTKSLVCTLRLRCCY